MSAPHGAVEEHKMNTMVTLKFTRKFTRGTLSGLIHNDSVKFESAQRCLEYIKAINKKHDAGLLDYFICESDCS